ncbi:MAG: type II toxin-antitoxin system RelE/ParE family toxin [Betaproteobacteria bacterium]|nr:type II toxin-antitoxin system RelE/ParE family toxin [Betaproteobacteria bacterium]
MAEYRLTPAAERDLESIWSYTTRQSPSCAHIRPGYRRWCVERHMIYFRMTDFGIAVVRVLHDRMDALRHL